MNGLRLASIYGYLPSNLGFCGRGFPGAAQILADFLKGKKIEIKKVRQALSGFEAAYSYYRLIAKVNRIADPLDLRVVSAYWLGNELLDKVKISDLQKLILKDFCRPDLLLGQQAAEKSEAIPKGIKPQHSFHVLFLGSVTGRVKFNTRLRDLCRISWGKVAKIYKKQLKVKYQPLIFKKNRFYLGKPAEKMVSRQKFILPKVEVGDLVSFHWNLACQVLSSKEAKNLARYTLLNIQAINERRK